MCTYLPGGGVMVLILLAVWFFRPSLFWKTENPCSKQTDGAIQKLTTKHHFCCIKVSLNDLEPLQTETEISKVLNTSFNIKTKLKK